jgi:hypothetical protein
MANNREYRFKIDVYTPTTIPMERLAEYMREVAVLFGEAKSVHFAKLEEGSMALVSVVEYEAVPKVEERVTKAKRGEGPREPQDAIRTINRKLKEDNGTGFLLENTGAQIIRFPGREEAQPISFGAFNEQGSLDGVVIVVGGKGDPVPVHLESSESVIYLCHASRTQAKELAKHIFGTELRVNGTGRWLRTESGKWQLERFLIGNFEVLNEQPLTSVVADLRAIPGSKWTSFTDPWAELDEIRNGPREKN